MKKKWTNRSLCWLFRCKKQWLVMKLFCILLIVFVLPASAAVYSQQKIDIRLENVTIETLIKEIKSKVKLDFLYNINELEKNGRISVQMDKATVEEILHEALKGKSLNFSIVNDVVVIRPENRTTTPQTQEVIKGIVKDKDGTAIPGVSVLLKGTNVGVITNAAGRYEIIKPKDNPIVLIFSFIGMKKKSVTYQGQNSLDVTMDEDVYELAEANVIHTGYQDLDRRRLTSAITSVSSKDVLVPGMTSIDQALEGRIPELMLINNSGEVGSTPRIRVRGTSSLMGNREPLWVLDGFIMRDPVNVSNDDLNNPDYINIVGNAIAGINPQDIERIDILKDAAATALYGTRAANGVIVVTTKKGAIGPARFSYNHSSKFTRRPRYSDRNVNLMNSQERVQFGKDLSDLHYNFPSSMPMVGYEGALNNYYTGKIDYDQFLKEVSRYEMVNTDWFKVLTRDGYSHDHTLSVSGGNPNVRYYISVGYNRENGVSKTTYTDRYTTRLNLDIKFTEKIKMNFSLNGNVQKKNHLADGIDAMDYAYNTTRALPCYNEDGSLYYYGKSSTKRWSENFRYNILNEIENSSNGYDGNTISANLDLKYTILKGFDVTVAGSYSRNNTLQEQWWGEKSFKIACLKNGELEDAPRPNKEGYCELPYGGILKTNNSMGESYTLRAQSDYHKYFGPDDQHMVNVMAGFEMNGSTSKTIGDESRGYLKERGLQFVDQVDLDLFPEYKTWINQNHRNIGYGISHQVSGYLTLSYSYKNHFTVNANGRFDASNKFGSRSNEKFLPIWSVSGMWNLKENILKDFEFLTDVRFRTSFGIQGNMLEDQSPNLIIKQGRIDPVYNENISTISRYPNPNLKWEQTKQMDAGLDILLFDSRLGLDASIYYKKTNDCFTNVQVSSVNGVPGNSYVMNGGNLSNSGYSLGVKGTPVKTKDFQWNVSTYFDGNFNKVKSETVETYQIGAYLNGLALVDGKSISSFFSYKYIGLNPSNGTPMFDDYHDRQHLLEYKNLEETVLMAMEKSGQRDPIFSGNLSNTFTYKSLSISMNLSYSLGSKVRLFPLYSPIRAGVSSADNVRKEFINRWVAPGDERYTDVPVIMSPADPEYEQYGKHFSSTPDSKHVQDFATSVWDMYDNSDLRVVSGNYLKCSSFSIRYNFDAKLLKKTPLTNCSISLNSLNLFTLSAKALKGQDPSQAGFAKPNLSIRPSYTLQFNVTF
ncbi:MAG: SusC/RagA family TonB-linked outer membrane protein [Odoribacter sp.]